MGAVEGLTVDRVIERYGDHYWRWLAAAADHPPGGEAMPRVAARARGVVEDLRARHPEGRVAAVTRGGVITRLGWPGGRLRSLDDTARLGEPA